MTWDQAVAGPLAGATCLWQDLDGLHVSHAPTSSPSTSILWGWRPDGTLIRARLDGATAFIATHHSTGGSAVRTVPWNPGSDGSEGDLRIAASHGRGPAPADGGVGAIYEKVIVDGINDHTGPITFLRPAPTGPGEHAPG
jgi:hypothetical protein